MSSHVKRLRDLITSNKMPSPFVDLIRQTKDIFWTPPKASLTEFTKAFRSPKTSPAVKYVMALSGLFEDPDLVNRSLQGLRSKLTFKISPEYVKKAGKLELSHFTVKGFSKHGHGEYLRINPKAKQMMMGTPVDTSRARIMSEAIKPSQPKTYVLKSLRQPTEKTLKNELKRIKEKSKIHTLPPEVKAEIKKLEELKKEELKLKDEFNLLKAKIEAEKKNRIASRVYEVDQLKQGGLRTFDEMRQMMDRLLKQQEQLDIAIRKRQNVIEWARSVEQHIENNDPDRIGVKVKADFSDTDGETISASKGKLRSLTAKERVKIYKAIREILKHLQGIMWVLHSTIKLNDKRHLIWYPDEASMEIEYSEDETTVELYGFPEHMQHYLREHEKFDPWISFIRSDEESLRLYYALTNCFIAGEDIQGRTYPNEELAQDDIENLLVMCATAMNEATKLTTIIMNSYSIFSQHVRSDLFSLPEVVPLHIPHPSNKSVSHFTNSADKISAKVKFYKNKYGVWALP